jgi:hypothetical protein
LERRRETVSVDGQRSVEDDVIRLDQLTARQLRREGAEVGLVDAGTRSVPETEDYVGSEVVLLRA